MAQGKEKVVKIEEKSAVAKKEEATLKFWQDHKIFEQSEAKLAAEEFVFYDGPPFATGTPHFGHLLPTSLKDAIPRYQTMKGKRVRRRWGWDCHGLPIENIVEAELGLKTKKDILDLGIDKFNAAARAALRRYTNDWEQIIPRLGRWVDMANAYWTMDASYTETVWKVFKDLYTKNLIYDGYKVMPFCPRCGTTLSNFEVNQGYKDIEDLAVTVEFELVDEPGTHLLAWTTTPWTLPGNVALAINPEIDYVKVMGEVAGNNYILAGARVKEIFGEEVKIVDKFSGRDLISKKYKSVFDYYQLQGQVYAADFVTTEEGTGIVHIAPAFGEDDYNLSKIESLPLIQHVGVDGKFKPEVKDFAGLAVKPKGNHQETDKRIIKFLEDQNKVFKFEQITHSYPHCWRCETPLLNYAASSWFVKVTEFKDKLVAANKKVNWIPEHIKEGRFGKWLEGARDWAISRSRFWGAPIPVWQCEDCKKFEVIGSLAELKQHLPKAQNNYWTIRHGWATSNADDRVSSRVEDDDHLLPKGVEEVKAAIPALMAEKIELIISSDFPRTKETAELIATGLGIKTEAIVFDERLREVNAGELEGQSWQEYDQFFKQHGWGIENKLPGGESLLDIRQRMFAVLMDLEKEYQGKNILIVSHGLPIFSLLAAAEGVPDEKLAQLKTVLGPIKQAAPYSVELNLWPRNENGSLDLHRPYIDEIRLACPDCGKEMIRVPEVFDCWFESGSMPYFDNLKYPADFIAEGLDQTRGWFYSLLVLGVALKGESPYKNVIVNGLILAADGQKMSKRLKNYPDLNVTIDKYGADALRFYLLGTPAVRAEDFAFSELAVAEVGRKVIGRLENVLNFYQTYALASDLGKMAPIESTNVLDHWIISRLNQTIEWVTKSLDQYEVDKATRELDRLIDDLSNWYLRRSRERFKSVDVKDRAAAVNVTYYVLRETAKLLAPITPFLAERLFQALKHDGDLLSVHLTDWPKAGEIDEMVINNMTRVRELVEQALALRGAQKIKVRQPLSTLALKEDLSADYTAILAEEVNVKAVIFDHTLTSDLELDFKLTPELKAEGEARELIRQIQDLRKLAGCAATDEVTLIVEAEGAAKALLQQFEVEIKRVAKIKEIIFAPAQTEVVINELTFKLTIKL